MSRRHNLSLLLAACSLAGWAYGGTVTIDATQVLSETGGDDLAAGRRIFQGAGYPEANGGLTPGLPIYTSVGQKYVRLINDLNAGDGCSIDASGNFVPCNRLNWALSEVKAKNFLPHVIVGQNQPDIAPFNSGPASQWSAATWAQYQTYAEATVRFVSAQYAGAGFPQAIFEVGNELEITFNPAELWATPNPNVGQFDLSRYDMEIKIFAVWSKAVDKVAKENPSKTLMVAGPSGWRADWTANFIRDVAAQGLRLDAVTYHWYNGLNAAPGMTGTYKDFIMTGRNALTTAGRPNTPIYITEFGPSDNGGDVRYLHVNYGVESAAWGAAFLHESLAATVTGGAFLLMRDVAGANTTGNPGSQSYTYVQNNQDYPKPITNAFQMFTLLPGTRKAATTPAAQPDIGALAGSSGISAAALVYNYNIQYPWPNAYYDATTTETVTVSFTHLSFNGSARLQRYLIDANTSNVAKFIDAGQVPVYAQTLLQQVQVTTVTVTNGTATMPALTLGKSAVSLWVLTSLAASACDVNGDAVTNVSDAQMCVNQALGFTACTADINHDGKCNVLDLQRVVNAALGGACVTTP